MDDSEIARYGLELARLAQASQWARRGIESQHPDVARPVIQDIQVSRIKPLLPSSFVLKNSSSHYIVRPSQISSTKRRPMHNETTT
jgi:hypothetical protein